MAKGGKKNKRARAPVKVTLSAAPLDVPPPGVDTPRIRQAVRWQGQRLDRAIDTVFPHGLPSKQQTPPSTIADAIEAHYAYRGWEACSRRTILRRIKDLQPPD
jgi:hypothetical protein